MVAAMSTDALRAYQLQSEHVRGERRWYFPLGPEGELHQLGSYLERAARRRVERLNNGEKVSTAEVERKLQPYVPS